MNTERIANQIAKAINEASGENVAVVDGSGKSESYYVEAPASDGDSFKIRISRHESRPTYEKLQPSGYHVGTVVNRDGLVIGQHQDSDGDWLAAVGWACRKLGAQVPPRIEKMIFRRDTAIAERKMLLQKKKLADEKDASDRQFAYKRVVASLGGNDRKTLADYQMKHGKARKNFRNSTKYKRAMRNLEMKKPIA